MKNINPFQAELILTAAITQLMAEAKEAELDILRCTHGDLVNARLAHNTPDDGYNRDVLLADAIKRMNRANNLALLARQLREDLHGSNLGGLVASLFQPTTRDITALYRHPTDGNVYFLDETGNLLAAPTDKEGGFNVMDGSDAYVTAEFPEEERNRIIAILQKS